MHQLPPLTDEEMQALAGLLDAGVRATGLRSVKDAAKLLEKLEAATMVEIEDEDEIVSAPKSDE